jgi:hypothetical protein
MEVRITPDGTLHIRAMGDIESFALLQWWSGYFTKDGQPRATRTTTIEIEYNNPVVAEDE